jgi:transcriptional regulator with XRE-family HTH domain
MRLPDYVVAAKPLPVAEVPAKPPVAEVEEPMEAEPVSETIAVDPSAFGRALKAERKAAGHSQGDVGAVTDADQSQVCAWEKGGRMQPEQHEALLQLFPALATVPKPPFATRAWGRVKKPAVRLVPALPAPENLPPITHFAAKVQPSTGAKFSLSGLRKAARALGITGPVNVIGDDHESQVSVGGEVWKGVNEDAAVETARAALDERLGVAMRRMEEARASLAGAA